MADWLPGPTSSVLQKAASGGYSYGGGGTFDRYLQQLQRAEQQAYLSNMARKEQIESIYDSIIEMYQPGGAFEARYLSQLGTRKAKDVGSEMQQLISSGLYGTTTTAGLGRRWEAEVGEPARLAMEDVMQQRLGMALGKKAEFLTGIEEEYPDYSSAAALAAQAASSGGGGGAAYSGGGAGGVGPAWLQQASARLASGQDYFKRPGSGIVVATGGQSGRTTAARKSLAPASAAEVKATTSTATKTKPTIAEFLQQHGIDPRSTNPADIARARKLQPLYKTKYG